MTAAPVYEIEAVLTWLEKLNSEAQETMPESDGGDISMLCRQAAKALELLLQADQANQTDIK